MSAYKRTNNRLILLNYDGTMLPKSLVDKTPSNEVILVLNELCSDPKNVVFVVSGRRKDCLSKWFSPCEKLGISAEHGYFTRYDYFTLKDYTCHNLLLNTSSRNTLIVTKVSYESKTKGNIL